MICKLKKSAKVLILCLALSFFLSKDALAFDRKESFALAHYIMGVMYEDIGDIPRAIQEYKKVLKVDKESVVVHLALASAFIKNNEIPKAIDELNNTVRLDPEAVEPHAILALLYSAQNEPELATGEYEKALKSAVKIQPKNIEIYKSLGAIYLLRKNLKEAKEVYQLIVDLSPNDSEAHFYLGSVYNELKNNALAEKELKRALELKPDYHEALNFLGYLYVEENKNLNQAENMIKEALALDPKNGAYIDSLGWLYFKKGNFTEALKKLEKASSLLEDPVIYDHLGDTCLRLNDTKGAKLNWEKSLKLNPKQDIVEKKLEELKNNGKQ